MSATRPCNNKKFYIYSDGTHTCTPCRSRVDEMNMKMRWKWPWHDKLPNRNTRRGTQKKTGKRENTNTNTPSPERANPERAREKKKRTDDGPNTDQRSGGRTEAPDTTYKARAKPTSAREGPKPDLTRVHKKMHPSTSAKIRVQAQRPSNFKSKPSGRLKWSISAQLNLTRSTKRKWPHLKGMSWSLNLGMLQYSKLITHPSNAAKISESYTSTPRVSAQRAASCSENGDSPKSGQLFYQRHPTGWTSKKWTTVSLYLNEVPGEKCKFRDQVEGSNILPRQVFPEGLMSPWRTDMSNTLDQNCRCEFFCRMQRTCKNTNY